MSPHEAVTIDAVDGLVSVSFYVVAEPCDQTTGAIVGFVVDPEVAADLARLLLVAAAKAKGDPEPHVFVVMNS